MNLSLSWCDLSVRLAGGDQGRVRAGGGRVEDGAGAAWHQGNERRDRLATMARGREDQEGYCATSQDLDLLLLKGGANWLL